MQIFAYLNTDEKKDYNHNNNPDDNEEELGGSYTGEGLMLIRLFTTDSHCEYLVIKSSTSSITRHKRLSGL